jgi:hypothetical protein
MSKEIIVKEFDVYKPQEMAKMSKLLKSHIVKQGLYVNIKEKNYVMVEGWQFAGGLLGLFPRIVSEENISNGATIKTIDGKELNEYKWLVKAELVNSRNDKIVGSGSATCSNRESKKRSFDEYAVLSMAQTRAIGKAFRNTIGWVMKMSGYEPTPAEEVDELKQEKTTLENVLSIVDKTNNIGVLIEQSELIKTNQILNDKEKEAVQKAIKTKVGKLEAETSKS